MKFLMKCDKCGRIEEMTDCYYDEEDGVYLCKKKYCTGEMHLID